MTVKEIFNKAYGELPENVVGCYIGYDVAYSGVNTMPTVTCGQDGLDMYAWSAKWNGGSEWLLIDSENCGPFGPDISLRDAGAFEGFFESNYNLAIAAELAQSQSEDIESLKFEIESLRLQVSDRLRQIDRLYDESYDVMKDQQTKIDHLNLIIKQIIEITGLIISCDETAIAGRGEVFELGKHYPELFAYMMAKLIGTEY